MKHLYIVFLGIVMLTLNFKIEAQNWQYVGKAEDNQSLIFSHSQGFQSLKVNIYGSPIVSYQDQSNGNKTTVLSFNGSNWSSVGGIGISAGGSAYQSLAIGSTGYPIVAYADVSHNYTTRVISFNGSNWTLLDSSHVNQGYSTNQSLTIGHTGNPLVAYQYNGGKTNVLSFSGGNWNDLTKIGITSFNGINWNSLGVASVSKKPSAHPSLAIGLSGNPVVAHHTTSSDGNKTSVVSFTGNSWIPLGGERITGGLHLLLVWLLVHLVYLS